jgi:hypothetical protein
MSSRGKAFNQPHNNKQRRESDKLARQDRKFRRAQARAEERAARRARVALAQSRA